MESNMEQITGNSPASRPRLDFDAQQYIAGGSDTPLVNPARDHIGIGENSRMDASASGADATGSDFFSDLSSFVARALALLSRPGRDLNTEPASSVSPEQHQSEVKSFSDYSSSLSHLEEGRSPESGRALVLSYQLHQKCPDLGASFEDSYQAKIESGLSPEDAAAGAVAEMRTSGGIEDWEAKWILDLSAEASSDVTPSDSVEAAQEKLEAALVGIQDGSRKVAGR